MPEGDALHRAAHKLQALVGERLEVETPHPRAAAGRIAERLDGKRLVSVEAHGKNLLFRFDDGRVLRSHLRMSGRWSVVDRGRARTGLPWLVLRGSRQEAVLWNGPVLELHERSLRDLGPDILAEPPDFDGTLERIRGADPGRQLGELLLDQRLVAGIGNIWRAEGLWRVRLSPWLRLCDVTDTELRGALAEISTLMRASVAGARINRAAYRRTGRPCPRCRTPILARGQGDLNRTAYWCPACQPDRPAPT